MILAANTNGLLICADCGKAKRPLVQVEGSIDSGECGPAYACRDCLVEGLEIIARHEAPARCPRVAVCGAPRQLCEQQPAACAAAAPGIGR